jgi:hypothetical protein
MKAGIEIGSEIPPKEIKIECRQCKEIVNNFTGRSFYRNLDPRAKWDILYYQAKMNSEGTSPEFTLVMDEHEPTVMRIEGEKGEELMPLYTERELEGTTMRKLQEIGRQHGCKSIRKRDLILQILQAQTALVLKAEPGQLPKG